MVYCHKDPGQWLKQLADAKIHRAGALELYSIDRTLVAALVTRMDRRMSFAVSISGRELFVAIGTDNLTGHVSPHSVARGLDPAPRAVAQFVVALAWRLTSTWPSLAGLLIGAKGFTPPGRSTWVLPGRAINRRGLGVVWPEKDPS